MKSINLGKINNILNKMIKWETDIKAVLLMDAKGKIISYKMNPNIEKQWDFDYIASKTGKVFNEYKKFKKTKNFNNFQWVIAEFDHGKITSIPIENYILCIIGHACPSIGGIRLILAQVKEDLLEALP